MKRKHACIAFFSRLKIRSNKENKSYNQIKMCMCVEFSGRNSHSFLHDSIFYFEIWTIFPPFFFFFMFLSMDIFYLPPFSFCISHIVLHDEYEESCQRDGAFLCGWKVCFA